MKLSLGWLNDLEVNRYLEVRWEPQTRESGLTFASAPSRTAKIATCGRSWRVRASV